MVNKYLSVMIAVFFFGSAAVVAAKDYQVTGPVVDVKEDAIIVKKGNDNWEIARDKDTKSEGGIKKGSKVLIKYKMTATSIEVKDAAKAKAATKTKSDEKAKTK